MTCLAPSSKRVISAYSSMTAVRECVTVLWQETSSCFDTNLCDNT